MKRLVVAAITALATLIAPVASADQTPWCEWTPELDTRSCDFIVGVPPTGTPVDGPGDWSTGETRTKN
ncbi:hypothetical protein BKG80_10865 [Mycobacteroides chelonae]|uniref:hypothetical protein n=1 Tax=Mycobacteroides chelonae TaxID=1774 RepID=UPI00091A676A|nr:hypothetical protein [Mycobacteroides chelonae]OHU38280.1 hypothetical protein BKG80_10865 [Mycobacteroides chelonae]